MGEVFVKVLNMSIAASWLILAVMLLRLALKKAPKWASVLLWGIVALRLAVPFSFESAWSLVPSAETFSTHNIQFETPAIRSGIPAVNSVVNPILGEAFAPGPGVSVNPLYVWMFAASVVWLAGIAAMLLYALISYARVRRSVAESVPYAENIFLCDHVKSPFILGLAAPKIYLPSHLDAAAVGPVIAHEKAHLARRDHWWKPLGFLILAVHWFNPLCWLAYVLLCRDIELACDEKVIRQLDLDGKKQYSAALLACSTGRRLVLVAICPLAFGEIGVKKRVQNVLHYKKPAFWIVLAAGIACVAAAVCFLTDPVTAEPGTPNAQRPALLMDGAFYVDPYMPVSSLPYGYRSAGKLTEEQANNTGLAGIEYFTHPSKTEDFYTWQECGTPIALDIVDSEQRQWAYVRWIRVGDDAIDGRRLTLDDVLMLSQKGDALTWSDFERYEGQEIGSGLYIVRYEIDELFEVRVGGMPEVTPMYVYLKVNNGAEDRIDIRTEDVFAFIAAHSNDVPGAAAIPDADPVIEALIQTVCSSPALSSNPEDYISEHDAAYRELTDYGRYTLQYCFARFEKGGEIGLEGQIMMRACGDIAAGWSEAPLEFFLPMDDVLTGQMWYDAFKTNALQLMEQYSETELAERWPASYLLLGMLGKV